MSSTVLPTVLLSVVPLRHAAVHRLFRKERDGIERQRHELLKKEQDAIQSVLREDEENKRFVSSVLRLSLEHIFVGEATREERQLTIEDLPSPVEEEDRDFLDDVWQRRSLKEH